MTSLIRKTCTSGRIGAYLVAAAALLLPAALLTLAEGAAAQTAEPSEITIYHSLDENGADPRSAEIPAGCTPGAAGGATTIDFDGLAAGTTVTDQFPGVLFSSPDTGASVTAFADDLGTSLPNYLWGGISDITVEFSPPVQGLSFLATGDNNSGVTAQVRVFYGGGSSTTVDIVSDGNISSPELVDLSSFSDVSRIEIFNQTDPSGLGFDDFNFTAGNSEPICVLGGGTDEVLKLWIFGGSENSLEGQTVCAQDFIDIPGEGAGNIIGGTGQEICGSALNFAITGPGRFKGAVRASPDEGDDGIDTLVFGSPCPLANDGEGPECYFPPELNNLKLLSMNFRTGGSTPNNLARHLVDLIIDTSSWREGDETEISVGGQGGGAKLQLLTIESETVASLPVPEPTQFVQLLSGLFGLAGLNRLRRKH